jgi:hypothetical protein
MRWTFGIYGGKGTCKIVNTPTLKSVFERHNKECEIVGADMSLMYECLYRRILEREFAALPPSTN